MRVKSTGLVILWSFITWQIISWLTMKYSVSFSANEYCVEFDFGIDGINLWIKSWSARRRYNGTRSAYIKRIFYDSMSSNLLSIITSVNVSSRFEPSKSKSAIPSLRIFNRSI